MPSKYGDLPDTRLPRFAPPQPVNFRRIRNEKQDDDGYGAEDKDEEENEDTIAALETLEAADESDPTYLLYPPLALRTPRQKRTQIVLLRELVLNIQMAFNHHLDGLHSAKEDCMDKARIVYNTKRFMKNEGVGL